MNTLKFDDAGTIKCQYCKKKMFYITQAEKEKVKRYIYGRHCCRGVEYGNQ